MLSSDANGLSPLRQLYNHEHWDVVLAENVSMYLQWCLFVGINREIVVDSRQDWVFLIDLLVCTLILVNFYRILGKRGLPGSTLRYEYAPENSKVI